MLSFFANLKIGARLYAGFGLVLALTAVMAISTTVEISLLRKDFDAYGNMASDALLVSEIDGDMGDLRLGVNRYIRTSEDADMDQANKAYAQVRHGVELAHKEIQNPVRAKLIDEIDLHSVAYHKGFEQIADLIHQRNELVNGQLNVIGPKIREQLTKLNEKLTKQGDYQTANLSGIVQEDFLSARLYVSKYLDTNDESAMERARSEFKEVEAALGHLSASIGAEHRGVVSAIATELPNYETAFEELAKVISARNKIREEVLDANGKTIGEKIEAVKASAHEDEDMLQKAAADSADASKIQNIVLVSVSILLGVLIAWYISRGIRGPVASLTTTMSRLADRDWTAVVEGENRKDELGHMARAVAFFKQNGMEHERSQAEAEQRAEEQRKAAREKMIEDYIEPFDKSVTAALDLLASASTQLQSTSELISGRSAEGQHQASIVAAASEEASANVQTVASAGEELTSSITEISRQVAESARISSEASEYASRTNEQINELAEAAQRIGDVISLINDIASQTNLLALNATIEAARAGEAGKGFAVVASEVKNLATQTAKATEDISAKIAEMQTATGKSVDAIKTISQTIDRISEINTTVASAVEEQGSATQEIARNVQEAARGTQEVSSSVSSVSNSIGETGAAATQVASSANELAQQGEQLRREVNAFLDKIRSAA